jgi:hypothetical protein
VLICFLPFLLHLLRCFKEALPRVDGIHATLSQVRKTLLLLFVRIHHNTQLPLDFDHLLNGDSENAVEKPNPIFMKNKDVPIGLSVESLSLLQLMKDDGHFHELYNVCTQRMVSLMEQPNAAQVVESARENQSVIETCRQITYSRLLGERGLLNKLALAQACMHANDRTALMYPMLMGEVENCPALFLVSVLMRKMTSDLFMTQIQLANLTPIVASEAIEAYTLSLAEFATGLRSFATRLIAARDHIASMSRFGFVLNYAGTSLLSSLVTGETAPPSGVMHANMDTQGIDTSGSHPLGGGGGAQPNWSPNAGASALPSSTSAGGSGGAGGSGTISAQGISEFLKYWSVLTKFKTDYNSLRYLSELGDLCQKLKQQVDLLFEHIKTLRNSTDVVKSYAMMEQAITDLRKFSNGVILATGQNVVTHDAPLEHFRGLLQQQAALVTHHASAMRTANNISTALRNGNGTSTSSTSSAAAAAAAAGGTGAGGMGGNSAAIAASQTSGGAMPNMERNGTWTPGGPNYMSSPSSSTAGGLGAEPFSPLTPLGPGGEYVTPEGPGGARMNMNTLGGGYTPGMGMGMTQYNGHHQPHTHHHQYPHHLGGMGSPDGMPMHPNQPTMYGFGHGQGHASGMSTPHGHMTPINNNIRGMGPPNPLSRHNTAPVGAGGGGHGGAEGMRAPVAAAAAAVAYPSSGSPNNGSPAGSRRNSGIIASLFGHGGGGSGHNISPAPEHQKPRNSVDGNGPGSPAHAQQEGKGGGSTSSASGRSTPTNPSLRVPSGGRQASSRTYSGNGAVAGPPTRHPFGGAASASGFASYDGSGASPGHTTNSTAIEAEGLAIGAQWPVPVTAPPSTRGSPRLSPQRYIVPDTVSTMLPPPSLGQSAQSAAAAGSSSSACGRVGEPSYPPTPAPGAGPHQQGAVAGLFGALFGLGGHHKDNHSHPHQKEPSHQQHQQHHPQHQESRRDLHNQKESFSSQSSSHSSYKDGPASSNGSPEGSHVPVAAAAASSANGHHLMANGCGSSGAPSPSSSSASAAAAAPGGAPGAAHSQGQGPEGAPAASAAAAAASSSSSSSRRNSDERKFSFNRAASVDAPRKQQRNEAKLLYSARAIW